MHVIDRQGRWIIGVSYDEEATIDTTWSDAGKYYVEDAMTGAIIRTYDWSINEMCERSGPVSLDFAEGGTAVRLTFHDGSTELDSLP